MTMTRMEIHTASGSNIFGGIVKIKVGDLVELQPTNNRNRQLRGQEKKHIWEVVELSPSTICFDGGPGISILHRATNHERWVHEDDIKILDYSENLR